MLDVLTFRGSLPTQVSSGLCPSVLKHKHFVTLHSTWKKQICLEYGKTKRRIYIQLEVMTL